MTLYIVRHGAAQRRGAKGVTDDAERVLTPEGRTRTRLAAEGLLAVGCRPDCMATSPLPRAEETARIMAEVLCPEAPLEPQRFLQPGATAGRVVEWLQRCGRDCAMIVGHMPDLAEIASELLTGDVGLDITFKKAGACCISFQDAPALGAGSLEWLLQPRQLRTLAATGKK